MLGPLLWPKQSMESEPKNILIVMTKLGQAFAKLGWTLRTGNCQGADQTFQSGANSVKPGSVELLLALAWL